MRPRWEFSNNILSAKIYMSEALLRRGGEDVAQMEAETLLPVDGKPSGEVAPKRAGHVEPTWS